MSRWQELKLWPRKRASLLVDGESASLAGIARGAALDVTVADGLSRGWLTTPPAGVTDLQELRALAEARFEAVFHTPTTTWRIEADWSGNRAFICSAIPVGLLYSLQTEAEASGVQLRSIAPQWVRALQRLPFGQIAREPLALACAVSPQGVAGLILRNGVPFDWRQHWCAPADAARHLRSQALAAGCELPAHAWACGDTATLTVLARDESVLRWKAVPA